MHSTKGALAILVAAALLPSALGAKDFPESTFAIDPAAFAREKGLPTGMGGSFEYGNYLFSHDDVDSFYLRSSLSPALLRLGDRFTLGGLYESVLMCGPVPSGDTAANIAAFWMNALQFEYGLYASYRLPGSLGLDLVAEYSRTSQHPMRPAYSEVATDILMGGIALPRLELGPIEGLGYLRIGYRDLAAFWQSSLPKPRVSWVAKPALEARAALPRAAPHGAELYCVLRLYPELFIDRYTKALDANLFAEGGLALSKGRYDDELLLTLYSTKDSDLLRGEAHPAFEAGLSVKLAAERLKAASNTQ
jgi:hypothetical protein